MARGDGKVVKGQTKGKMLGTKRMATGGFASSSREGGFAGAGAGRLESPGQRSSVSPGGGNISAGNTPGGGGGGGGRSDMRSPVSNAARSDYLRDASRASVRLGPNAAQSLADAGVNPNVANLAARSINRMAPSGSSILSGQRTAAPAAPKSPMDVYGDEFSFTPEQKTNALKSMYSAGLPGAKYGQLMGLKKAMQEPENKAMASALAAPFSSRTRAPVKSISDRVTQDPNYSTKDQESLLGTNTPAIARGDAVNATNISKTPATRAITAAPVAASLPDAKTPKAPAVRPAAPSVVSGGNFSAGASPYRERGDGGGDGGLRKKKRLLPREKRGFGDREGGRMSNGGTVRGDGKSLTGKTKGRMV